MIEKKIKDIWGLCEYLLIFSLCLEYLSAMNENSSNWKSAY